MKPAVSVVSEDSRMAESSAAGSRQVQFGKPQRAGSEDASEDAVAVQVTEQSIDDSDDFSENINERLRHEAPAADAMLRVNCFPRVAAAAAKAVVQEALHQVVVVRETNDMAEVEVNLDYVPLYEKYAKREYDMEMERFANVDDAFPALQKLRRDLSWLERILRTLVVNLNDDFYFDELEKILMDDQHTRQEERTLLSSKEFNQRELEKLRFYMDREKRDMARMIQSVTEKLGNAKDEFNDSIFEDKIKSKYVVDWQNSRHEQNKLILSNQERMYKETTMKMNKEIDKENRVHDEMWQFLKDSTEEYKEKIEKWMETYDGDLEEKEQDIQKMKITIENQKDEYTALQEEYDRRQQAIEDFKAYKLRVQQEKEELERRTKAATRIQSWWRGVMFRKGLGPWRRKKKKKGNETGGSGKQKKK